MTTRTIILLVRYNVSGGKRLKYTGTGTLEKVIVDGVARAPKHSNLARVYQWLMDNQYVIGPKHWIGQRLVGLQLREETFTKEIEDGEVKSDSDTERPYRAGGETVYPSHLYSGGLCGDRGGGRCDEDAPAYRRD